MDVWSSGPTPMLFRIEHASVQDKSAVAMANGLGGVVALAACRKDRVKVR